MKKINLEKHRNREVLLLGFLTIWRIIVEIFRFITFILFFIPMLLSSDVYEILKNFYYLSLEDNIDINEEVANESHLDDL